MPTAPPDKPADPARPNGRPTAAAPAPVPRPADPVSDLYRQYVSGGSFGPIVEGYANYLRVLPHYVDDLTADLGEDLYQRMATDPAIAACLSKLHCAILQDGVQLTPPDLPEDDPDAELAAKVTDFCRRMLDRLERPVLEVLDSLLDGLALGSKLAELTWEAGDDPDDPDAGPRIWLKSIRPKPRRATAWVIDPLGEIAGILAVIPGRYLPTYITGLYVSDGKPVANLLPRTKFLVFSWRPRDNDPRGTSILRPAYNAWWGKMGAWNELNKWLAQFAVPSLIGFTPPNVVEDVPRDADDNPTGGVPISPEQVMQTTLAGMRNGTAAAFRGGSSVMPVPAQPGSHFIDAFALFDRQMVLAIETQTRNTLEAENGSKADSQTGQDAYGLLVRRGKLALAAALREDVLRQAVALNYGKPIADRFTPAVSFGSTEHQDKTQLMQAIATWKSAGLTTDSMVPKLNAMVGLPVPTDEDLQAAAERKQQLATAQAAARGLPPGGNGKPPGANGKADDEAYDKAQDAKDGTDKFAEFKAAVEPEADTGHWITANGAHIYIRDGKVVEGMGVKPGMVPVNRIQVGEGKAKQVSYHHPDPAQHTEALGKQAKGLHLPPAWAGVQVSADPAAKLQAIGYDKKGREQRRYSAEHVAGAAAEKFSRVKAMVEHLPKLDSAIHEHVNGPEGPRKEAAAALMLIRRTGLRPGSDKDTKAEEKAHGATNLRAEHVKVEGDTVHLDFIGKKGVRIQQSLHDPELAKHLAPRAAKGGRLFATDETKLRGYLKEHAGKAFKTKDLRTAAAAETALHAMAGMPEPKSATAFAKARLEVGKQVAAKLGNTPAVALRAYVPPEVFARWEANI